MTFWLRRRVHKKTVLSSFFFICNLNKGCKPTFEGLLLKLYIILCSVLALGDMTGSLCGDMYTEWRLDTRRGDVVWHRVGGSGERGGTSCRNKTTLMHTKRIKDLAQCFAQWLNFRQNGSTTFQKCRCTEFDLAAKVKTNDFTWILLLIPQCLLIFFAYIMTCFANKLIWS